MRFSLQVLHPDGRLSQLEVDAPDAGQAKQLARVGGVAIISATEISGTGKLFQKRRRFPIVLFCQELLALLRAGLSIVEGIETLAEKESNGESRQILLGLQTELRQGRGFSMALAAFPEHFPALLVATVKASEQTGDLEHSIARFIAYELQIDQVRKKVVSASIYPLLLIVIGGLVTLFLLAYVVPRFSSVYQDAGKEMPALSGALIVVGNFLSAYWLPLALAVAGLVIGLMHAWRKGWITSLLLQLSQRLPALNEMLLVFSLARCYRTMGMLLSGGIPLPAAMEMVSGLVASNMRDNLATARERVSEGIPFSVAAEACGLVTPVATRLLRVGEKGGNLGEMMERIAAFYDEDIQRWTDYMTKLIEPLLMAVIGIVIGGIVVLLYLPVFDLAAGVQ